MNQINKETRHFTFEVRAENDEKHGNFLSGRPIVYESKTNLNYFDEIIKAGALDKTDLKDVRFLVNHNLDMIPLARSRNNNENSTMQMSVDKIGMAIRVNLDTENNAEAKALYSAVQRGDIDGMSFMFTIDAEEWSNLESDHPTRTITKIGKVFEVSAVTFPAYADTEISARSKDALENARKALERAKDITTDDVELEKLKAKYLYNTEV